MIGGDQQVYPYSFRHTRVDHWTYCLHMCLFSTYVHGEAQGWTHFTLFISFLLCCFKLCNHLHTINCDIWLLSTTTTSFLHWLIDQCPALAQDLHPGANLFAL